MNFKEKEFVIYKFVQDGCPRKEAEKESWESMVKNLFDGDETVARDEFKEFCKKPWEEFKKDLPL